MDTIEQVDQIVAAARQCEMTPHRCLIGIGGPPASGKSTLAAQVCDRLTAEGHLCATVPMDGFHLDNATLRARGLLTRKGAPETFDGAGFVRLVAQLPEPKDLHIPLFDRAQDCVLPDATTLRKDTRYVIVEGNYLFLRSGDWPLLTPYWSLRVFLAPPLKVSEQRLLQRWITHGLPPKAAAQRTRENDLPNARTVLEESDLSQIDLMLSQADPVPQIFP